MDNNYELRGLLIRCADGKEREMWFGHNAKYTTFDTGTSCGIRVKMDTAVDLLVFGFHPNYETPMVDHFDPGDVVVCFNGTSGFRDYKIGTILHIMVKAKPRLGNIPYFMIE
jgi:hypothetical protein